MMVLGWWTDIHRPLLHLLKDNFDQGRKECVAFLANPIITIEALNSLIVKLVRAAYVILLARQFLSRLHSLLAWLKERKIERLLSLPQEKLEEV